MEASIVAFWSMSVKVAMPMSAAPRRDIVVPAPVWVGVLVMVTRDTDNDL